MSSGLETVTAVYNRLSFEQMTEYRNAVIQVTPPSCLLDDGLIYGDGRVLMPKTTDCCATRVPRIEMTRARAFGRHRERLGPFPDEPQRLRQRTGERAECTELADAMDGRLGGGDGTSRSSTTVCGASRSPTRTAMSSGSFGSTTATHRESRRKRGEHE